MVNSIAEVSGVKRDNLGSGSCYTLRPIQLQIIQAYKSNVKYIVQGSKSIK